MKKHVQITAEQVRHNGDVTQTVQAILDGIQQRQEQAVNAGHRPDRAVRAILAWQDERNAIVRATAALHRAVAHSFAACDRINDSILYEDKF